MSIRKLEKDFSETCPVFENQLTKIFPESSAFKITFPHHFLAQSVFIFLIKTKLKSVPALIDKSRIFIN